MIEAVSRSAERDVDQLLTENQSLRLRLHDTLTRLEEVEGTIAAIREGQIDAVVVDRREQPEIWTLEAADRLQLKIALQAANAGTWHWDLRTDTVSVSESMLRVWGLPADAVVDIGKLRATVHPDDRQQAWQIVQRAIAGDDVDYYQEYRLLRPDGAIRWIASRGRIIRGNDGKADRVLGVSLDITERRATEEALRDADRRKDEFLAMLAHELRNPLAAITNAIRLSQSPSLAEPDRTWVEQTLNQQVVQLGRLVDDLLDVARISRGRIELKQEPLPLGEQVSRAIDGVRPLIERGRHTLKVSLPEKPVWIMADSSRMQQILGNLLTNAAKYTKENGQIFLRVVPEGASVAISIRDNGIGISAEMLPRVFEPFAQAEQGLERSQGGLGIGLTLVRTLVEKHGGSIEARSEGIGRGSEFTMRLPVIEPPAASSTATPPAPHFKAREAARLRILIVDDNEDAARTLGLLLRTVGHNTAIAFSGKEALQVAAQIKPDVALLDLGLPEINGFELALELGRTQSETLLVAVSGYGQDEDRLRSKQCGFAEHFIKPVKLDELLEFLQTRCGAAV